jgi:enolase-phosphatase E1
MSSLGTSSSPRAAGGDRLLLLDIEGTTSSVSFVYDVMFPYARRELRGFLRQACDRQELREAVEWMARDAGFPSIRAWLGTDQLPDALEAIEEEALRRMESDSKSTGLKQLQGLIWRDGFQRGELQAHVYDDVPECLRQRHARGLDTRIYSSGSVEAQRLFFAHTIAGDLSNCLRGHYDTTSGPKQATESYRTIADACARPANEILFVSDVVAELNAARQAGMATALAVRPGNRLVADAEGHPEIRSFAELPRGGGH